MLFPNFHLVLPSLTINFLHGALCYNISISIFTLQSVIIFLTFLSYLSLYAGLNDNVMFCCQIDDNSNKETVIQYHQSPFKIRMLEKLGLKEYAIDQLVFVRPVSNYQFKNEEDGEEFRVKGVPYLPPFGYQANCRLISSSTASIPLVHLKHKQKQTKPVIIFVHGNGSDLAQSMNLICSLAQMHTAEYLAFDYSGYGMSTIKRTTPESICSDLEHVLAWLDRPLSEIILIGFSLGCYPVAKMASKYKVKGVVMISPMMSLISLVAGQHDLGVNSFFKNDELNTFETIQNIESHLMLIHSKTDEMIPFRHSELIYQRYTRLSKNPSVHFIEIQGLGHNQLLAYLMHPSDNQLQKEFFSFLGKVETSQCVDYLIERRSKRYFLRKNGQLSKEQGDEVKKEVESKRKRVQKVANVHLGSIRKQLTAK